MEIHLKDIWLFFNPFEGNMALNHTPHLWSHRRTFSQHKAAQGSQIIGRFTPDGFGWSDPRLPNCIQIWRKKTQIYTSHHEWPREGSGVWKKIELWCWSHVYLWDRFIIIGFFLCWSNEGTSAVKSLCWSRW